MDWNQETIISLSQIGVTLFVGGILLWQITAQAGVISSMKTNMDTMKSLNDMYNPDKLKSYNEALVKNAELRYKSLYDQKVNALVANLSQKNKDEVLEVIREIEEGYDELLKAYIPYLASLPKSEREPIFKAFPKNEHLFRTEVNKILAKEMSKLMKNPEDDSTNTP